MTLRKVTRADLHTTGEKADVDLVQTRTPRCIEYVLLLQKQILYEHVDFRMCLDFVLQQQILGTLIKQMMDCVCMCRHSFENIQTLLSRSEDCPEALLALGLCSERHDDHGGRAAKVARSHHLKHIWLLHPM